MSQHSEELRSENCYESNPQLDTLKRFNGTPEEFVAHVESLYGVGSVTIEDIEDRVVGPAKKITFVTHGQIEAEKVSDIIEGTLFHDAYWEMSRRGGYTEYIISNKQWSRSNDWS